MADWKNSRVTMLAAATLLLGAGLGLAARHNVATKGSSRLVAVPAAPASASGSGSGSANTAPSSATTGPAAPSTTTSPNATAPPRSGVAPPTTQPLVAPTAPPQAPKPRQWVTVASFSGTGKGPTNPIQFLTGDARASYSVQSATDSITVSLVPAGTTANPTDQAIIRCSQGCGGTNSGTVAPGSYSLYIDAPSRWVVVVQEAR